MFCSEASQRLACVCNVMCAMRGDMFAADCDLSSDKFPLQTLLKVDLNNKAGAPLS